MGRRASKLAYNGSAVQLEVGYHYKLLGNLFSVLSYEKVPFLYGIMLRN